MFTRVTSPQTVTSRDFCAHVLDRVRPEFKPCICAVDQEVALLRMRCMIDRDDGLI